jgi:hypothetical protein
MMKRTNLTTSAISALGSGKWMVVGLVLICWIDGGLRARIFGLTVGGVGKMPR